MTEELDTGDTCDRADFEHKVEAMLQRRAEDIAERDPGAQRVTSAPAPRATTTEAAVTTTLAATASARMPLAIPRSRRRLPAIAAAIALIAALGLGLWAVSDRNDGSTLATGGEQPTTGATAGGAPAATASPTPDARNAATSPVTDADEVEPPSEPLSTGAQDTEPTVTGGDTFATGPDEEPDDPIDGLIFDDDTTVFVPSGWEVTHLSTTFEPGNGSPDDRVVTITLADGGPFDTVVWAYLVEDAHYTGIGTRGASYFDTTDDLDRLVRVRDERADGALAVVDLGGDALTVEAHGIDDGTLLEVIGHLEVIDGDVTVTSPDTLPGELRPVTMPHDGAWQNLQLSMQSGGTVAGHLAVFPENSWQMALLARDMHDDSVAVDAFGGDAIAYGYSTQSRDNPGAVAVVDGFIHSLTLDSVGPSDQHPTLDEVLDVLDTLEPRTLGEITAELGYQDRAEIIGDWIAETPLPEGADLSWLLRGPSIDPSQEAYIVHAVMACTWIGEWVKTGDPAELEQIADEADWPTAVVLDDQAVADGRQPGRYSWVDVDRYPASGSVTERAETALADCGYLIGDAEPTPAIARLWIPDIDVDLPVVEGVDAEALRATVAGHYPETGLPGQAGNAAIAAHRTTYGAPFLRLDELEPGDSIFVTTPYGAFEYRVTSSQVTEPNDERVLGDFGDNRLTLTTEHPKYSARERLVIVADLVGHPAEAVPLAELPGFGED